MSNWVQGIPGPLSDFLLTFIKWRNVHIDNIMSMFVEITETLQLLTGTLSVSTNGATIAGRIEDGTRFGVAKAPD